MSDIKNIIKEEIINFLQEQTETMSPQSQKQTAIANVNKHIRLLKLMKSNTKQIKMPPEYDKMAEELKKANTATFLEQFLGVKDDIPIKIDAILTRPLEAIQAVIDEIINVALKNARQKLQESGIKFPKDYMDKKKKKDIKKKGKEVPPPVLDEEK